MYLKNEINWYDSGLIDGIHSDKMKDKVIRSFNVARELILENNSNKKLPQLRECVNVVVFPIIRRCLYVNDSELSCIKDEEFEFDREKMNSFLWMISDLSDIYLIEKHFRTLDAQAEICSHLCTLYVAEQNNTFRTQQRLIKKQIN